MKNSLEILKQIYKPYRFTIMGKCTLLESTSGNFIVKENNDKNINELFNYLKSRNFTNFPKLVENNRSDVNVYEFVEDFNIPKEQKMDDLINIVASLHDKTSFSKEVTNDKFKEIYENILSNILYKEKFYSDLVLLAEDCVFPSPSNQLLLINSSKIFSSLDFCKKELEEWYSLVENKKKQKVSLVHNNLKLEHFIKNDKDYLISWDKAKIDTPVLDLVTLYRNEWYTIDFFDKLNKYLNYYQLDEDELKLFYLLIIIPDEIDLNKNELLNVKDVRYLIDYIFKTEELARSYYSKDKKE